MEIILVPSSIRAAKIAVKANTVGIALARTLLSLNGFVTRDQRRIARMIRPTSALRRKQQERFVVEQRLLLHDVSWEQYEAFGEALRDRAALRITYDRG